MTVHEVEQMMDELDIPTSYYKFDEGTGVQPPFAVWYFSESNDVLADGRNYVDVNHLVIELYTDERDFDLEQTVKDVLASHDLVYTWDTDYISEEMMYETIFETEVIFNA